MMHTRDGVNNTHEQRLPMSLWGVHVGVAVLVTTLILYVITPGREYRWVVIVVSGSWAIVPDLYWVVPSLRPILKPHVHDTVVANLFWFHGWLDTVDPHDSPLLSLLIGGLAIVVVLRMEVKLRDGVDT